MKKYTSEHQAGTPGPIQQLVMRLVNDSTCVVEDATPEEIRHIERDKDGKLTIGGIEWVPFGGGTIPFIKSEVESPSDGWRLSTNGDFSTRTPPKQRLYHAESTNLEGVEMDVTITPNDLPPGQATARVYVTISSYSDQLSRVIFRLISPQGGDMGQMPEFDSGYLVCQQTLDLEVGLHTIVATRSTASRDVVDSGIAPFIALTAVVLKR